MKIITASQTRELDRFTIEHEPISSLNLMERAALAFSDWFRYNFEDTKRPVFIFCGPGNNGGDGLAVARLLKNYDYTVIVFLCEISKNKSADYEQNLVRLEAITVDGIHTLNEGDSFPKLIKDAYLIDALFGTGLNRTIEWYWADLLEYLNGFTGIKVAVDIPSGMFADRHTNGVSFEADYTFSFELPKLGFLMPENISRVGEWSTGTIHLHPGGLAQMETDFFYIEKSLIQSIYRKPGKFDHKGTNGHALLVVGSIGKFGAAVLSAKACLRGGVGLLSIYSPLAGYNILQTTVPEAMVEVDPNDYYISQIPDPTNYKVLGMGCGLAQQEITKVALRGLLDITDQPMVLDADALNIIAEKGWEHKIPTGSILTPHPKEFERLFGKTENNFKRLEVLRSASIRLNSVILLKGAHTAIAAPNGQIYFNSTGNPGMATAGSGDVLTGLLTALMCRSYNALEAAILGVYLHGLAGDLATQEQGEEALIAGDIIAYLGKAFKEIRN